MISVALGTRSNIKVIYLFSLTPGKKFSRKDIQLLTKLANNPLNEALRFLMNTGLLIKTKRLYSLNFDNAETDEIVTFLKKESSRLKNISYSIWLVLYDFVVKIVDKMDVEGIYLFGSHAKLIAHEKSDIDIAIFVEKREPKTDFKIEKIISFLEKKYAKKIQTHVFEKTEFDKGSKLISEIMKDGIRLI